MPLILLGLLVRHLAGLGVAVPSWGGWGLAAWCLASPCFAGVVAGLLIVVASYRGRTR